MRRPRVAIVASGDTLALWQFAAARDIIREHDATIFLVSPDALSQVPLGAPLPLDLPLAGNASRFDPITRIGSLNLLQLTGKPACSIADLKSSPQAFDLILDFVDALETRRDLAPARPAFGIEFGNSNDSAERAAFWDVYRATRCRGSNSDDVSFVALDLLSYRSDILLRTVVQSILRKIRQRIPYRCFSSLGSRPARTQAHEVERFTALGAAGVITKPFDPMTLARTARSFLTK